MRIRTTFSRGLSGGPSRLVGRSTKTDVIPGASESLSPLDILKALDAWQAGEAGAKQAVRWSAEAPITVTIASPPNGRWVETEVCRLLDMALKQWELAAQGKLRFTWDFSAPDDGDIHIRWSNETVYGRDYEVGHTDRTVQGKWIRQAMITLIVDPAIDAQLLPSRRKQRLYSTLLHELGHALGLEHSESDQDVMHHRGWRIQALSPNDIRNLQALYSQSGFHL